MDFLFVDGLLCFPDFYFVVPIVYFCFSCLRRHIHKYVAVADVQEVTACFLLGVLWFQISHLGLKSILSLFCINKISIVQESGPVFPTPSVVFSPLYIFAPFNWVYFWALCSVPMIYVSIFVPVPYYFIIAL